MSHTHYIIRPVGQCDLDDMYDLASLAGEGFTSLQPDKDYLSGFIAKSEASFAKPDKTQQQKFLLVLEDGATGKVVGCAAVKTNIGGAHQFLNFRLVGPDGAPAAPGVRGAQLLPATHLDGATEVGSLFLHPERRQDGIGRYLAKVRYLLIAATPEIFGDTVVAELRGVTNPDGSSSFFNALYGKRLGLTFEEADGRYATADEATLRSLLPAEPIYVDALPLPAQAVIGEPNATGRGAYKLLLKEGFRFIDTVDLFDAGPIVTARRDDLKILKEAKHHTVALDTSPTPNAYGLAASGSVAEFRAVLTPLSMGPRGVALTDPVASALGARTGDSVRVWTNAEAASAATPALHQKSAVGA
ncbi:MAG: arginine N-succinyltransferase [Pseudomonadota bacterium]